MFEKMRYFLILLLIAPFCAVFAASSGSLTAEDAGQIVFRKQDAGVFVFRKNSGKKWLCEPFRENGSEVLSPGECILTEFHEDTLSPEAVAFCFAYFSGRARDRGFSAAYRTMAQRLNAPATAHILQFETALRKDEESIADEIRTFRKKQPNPIQNTAPVPESSLVDALLVLLETGSSVSVITEILDKEQNFFVAFCLWDRYLQTVSRRFSGLTADEQRVLNKEISKTGNEILAKYQQHCGTLLKRNTDFKKLCPRKYGPWGYAPPRDFREMRKRIDSCFLAWRKMQSCSAFSEFPDWGSAALEVMQMIRSPELEQKFDTAYRNYQKLLND